MVLVREQPKVFVPTTEYVVVTVGVTAIDAVVPPVFQLYVEAPVAVSVTLVEDPEQIEAVLAVTFTVGDGVTVIVF